MNCTIMFDIIHAKDKNFNFFHLSTTSSLYFIIYLHLNKEESNLMSGGK